MQEVSEQALVAKDTLELSEDELVHAELEQRAKEDSTAYATLDTYTGTYTLQTESDGVQVHLILEYMGDKVFRFDWEFKEDQEEAQCSGKFSGDLLMDRTQHGFCACEQATMHVHFNGTWSGHDVVEVVFQDMLSCTSIVGACEFGGTYTKYSK